MLEEFLRIPEARDFLNDYPKAKWRICVESIFVYGLYSIKKDFPNGLSIPELMRISGYEGLGSDSVTQVKAKSKREDPELFHKIRETEPESFDRKMKSSGSQTFTTQEKIPEKTKTRKQSISENIKEPRICSIENARKLMNTSSDTSFQSRLGRLGIEKDKFCDFEVNIDYIPKTIQPEPFKKSKVYLGSPKFKYS